MSYETNIYYRPEASGLEKVEDLSQNLSYEFNILLVLRHIKSKRIFWTQDSGCSCPTPFGKHYFKSPDKNSLDEITLERFKEFERDVENFPVSREERDSCVFKVSQLLRDTFSVKPYFESL